VSDLEADVRRFLYANIRSVPELELLLLLRQHADRARTAEELATALGLAQPPLERMLFDLMARGLLTPTRVLPIAYRYGPRAPETARAVDRLAELYPDHRLAVGQLIRDREDESLRLFSDAFRLRRQD
jgi:hypothetical protein